MYLSLKTNRNKNVKIDVSNPFHIFRALDFKQMHQISVKHNLTIFMTDKTNKKTCEHPRGPLVHQLSDRQTSLPMLNSYCVLLYLLINE